MFEQILKAAMISHKNGRTPNSRPAYSVVGWILLVIVMLYLGVLLFQSRLPNVCGAPRTTGDLDRLAESFERYEEEYGKLPNAPSMDFETEGPQAVELITVLLGKEDTDATM